MKNEIEITGFSTMTSSIEFANNYNNWILGKFSRYVGRNLLEIGTGQGNFKTYLSQKVDRYTSVDIDEQVIERAKQRDPKGNYLVADASSGEFVEKLAELSPDTIICINVLEHIPEHEKALENFMRILKPGGHLLLFVPAFQSLYNDMDRLAGHCRRYRRKDITQLTKNMNVKVLRNEYFNSIGGVGWWVNKFKKHTNLDSKNLNQQVLFFEKYVVPLSKFVNPLFKKVFGQSLLCVVQKPL